MVNIPKEEKKRLKRALYDYHKKYGIRTEDELFKVIQHILGFRVPRISVCEGHCAPFKFISDNFFSKVRNSLSFANRSGGKTRNFAILESLESLFKKKFDSVNCGAIVKQANRCYNYIKEMAVDNDITKSDVKGQSTLSDTSFKNGSKIEVITGTMEGVNGPHPIAANIDEIDLMSNDVLQQALSMSQSKESYVAATRMASTRKFPDGNMQKMLNEATKRLIKIYEWCCFEVAERCIWESCDKCKNEIIKYDKNNQPHTWYSICQEKLRRSDGYYKIEDLIYDKFLNLDFDVFEAEWLNRKPNVHALVYPGFSLSLHGIKPAKIPDEWIHFRGLDFGFDHPFACVWLARSPLGVWVLYCSVKKSNIGTREAAELVQKLSPRGVTYEYNFRDPSAKLAAYDLYHQIDSNGNRIGIQTHKAINDVVLGIKKVTEKFSLKSFIGYPQPLARFFVFMTPQNQDWIDEATYYQWKRDSQGRYLTNESVLKINDDLMDATRYVICTVELWMDRLKRKGKNIYIERGYINEKRAKYIDNQLKQMDQSDEAC